VRIAVDAMGGDYAPHEIVKGSLEAAVNMPEVEIILVGDSEQIQNVEGYKKLDNVSVRHVKGVISFNDDPVSRSMENSISVCCNLVKNKEADAYVSAGNTGACMASSVILWKRIEKIDRPAIPITIPTPKGQVVLIDAGANVDCKALNLYQFAVMGAKYCEAIYGVKNPRIAVFSNGTEDKKGNKLSLETFELLKNSKLNFVGNVEGKSLFKDVCDVIVCDGFVGNAILKTIEATAEMIFSTAKELMVAVQTGKQNGTGEKSQDKMPGSMSDFLQLLKKKLDYSEYGGAPLLGVNGTCIISHGSSKAKAVKNAIAVAKKFVNEQINKKIQHDIEVLF